MTIANDFQIARNPDTLYATALGAVKMSPAVQAILSPVARSVFDLAYNTAKGIAGEALDTLGSAALSEAAEIVGQDTLNAVSGIVGSVASAVSDFMPVLGTIVNLAMLAGGIGAGHAAEAQAYAEQRCHDFLNFGPGSGPGDAYTPADLFAPLPWIASIAAKDPSNPHAVDVYFWRPANPIGAALVAVTEDNRQTGLACIGGDTGPAYDDNLLHDFCVFDYAKSEYLRGQPGDTNVGIAPERRLVYQALRRAIGSHHEKDQGGAALFAIYADMLVDDFMAGHLTGPWMVYLLENVFVPERGMVTVDPSENLLGGNVLAPCPEAAFVQIVHSIGDLVASWAKNRPASVPHGVLKFPSAVIGSIGIHSKDAATTALKKPLSPKSRAQWEKLALQAGVSPVVIAALAPHGYSPLVSPRLTKGASAAAMRYARKHAPLPLLSPTLAKMVFK